MAERERASRTVIPRLHPPVAVIHPIAVWIVARIKADRLAKGQ